jgi:hypothetical protein
MSMACASADAPSDMTDITADARGRPIRRIRIAPSASARAMVSKVIAVTRHPTEE